MVPFIKLEGVKMVFAQQDHATRLEFVFSRFCFRLGLCLVWKDQAYRCNTLKTCWRSGKDWGTAWSFNVSRTSPCTLEHSGGHFPKKYLIQIDRTNIMSTLTQRRSTHPIPVSSISFVNVSFKFSFIFSTFPELCCLQTQCSFQFTTNALAISCETVLTKDDSLSDQITTRISNLGTIFMLLCK